VNEHLSVKARFEEGEHVEWMWFVVTSWKNDRLKGTLSNTPMFLKGLKYGAVVDAPVDELGDYSLYDGDTLEEGQILARLMNKKPPR
jgi:uncharacterized protein YegJ (DUF2314 family)